MAKPTLLQSILGKPSQTYHFPPSKEYFSNKQDLFRVAADPNSLDVPLDTVSVLGPTSGSQHSSSPLGSVTSSQTRSSSPRRSSRDPETASRSRKNSSNSRHSKSRPLSQSAASSHSTSDHQTGKTTPPTSFSGDTTPKRSPLSSLHRHSITFEEKTGRQTPSTKGQEGDNRSVAGTDTTDEEEDIFYTPRSSFYSSPRTSRSSAGMLIDPRALTYALLPLPSSPLATPKSSIKSKQSADGLALGSGADGLPISRTSSESSFTSTTSSSSTEETVRSYVNSTSRATTSSRVTSPLTSEYAPRTRANGVETVAIASSHRRSSSDSQPTVRGQPRPLAATSTRRRRSQSEIHRTTYTDEDWAKDVRWLAPVDPAQSDSPRRRSTSLPPDIVAPTDIPPSHTALPSTRLLSPQRGPASYPPPARSAEHRKRSSRRSRGSRSSRGRMSALLEEDESEYSDLTPTSSSTEPSRAPSPVQEELPDDTPLPSSSLAVSVVRSPSHRSAKENSSDDAAESPDARLQAYAKQQRRRTYSHTRRLSRSISPTTFAYSQTLPTHSIPTPPPNTDAQSSTHGYTGLTLPRANYANDGKNRLEDGRVDLVRAGIAQSSMATVEVTRGVAQLGPADTRRKRRALSFNISLKFLNVKGLGKVKWKGKEGRTPTHLLDTLPLPLEFTSHVPPPSYTPSEYVLLQVFAVAVDGLDSLLVYEKAGSDGKGAGFIPGRSVVGKVIEIGWEVKEDVCRKGEWVIALLDISKSGALAEFILVDRHRVCRAPQPMSRPQTMFSSRRSHVRANSLPTNFNKHPYSQIHRDLLASTSLTMEELALLPLAALPAHRAVLTFSDVIAPVKPRPDKDPSRARRPRIFVLQGHDGAGAMAVQMLARRGVRVCVQVPDSAARDDTNEGDDEDENTSPSSQAKRTRFDRLDARLRSWGAEEICVGDPLEVLERFIEDGRSFDGVLDTVGGVEIWEQSRRVLLADPDSDPTSSLQASPGTPTTPPSVTSSSKSSRVSSGKRTLTVTQFTTLVGDNPSRPIPSAHDNFRSGIRSLKRTMSTAGGRSRSGSPSASSSNLLTSPSKDSLGSILRRNSTNNKAKMQKRTVGYAWVCTAANVDSEGEDVRDTLGTVISLVEEGWIRPWIGDDEDGLKIVPFDKAPELFRRHGDSPVGMLKDGGTCVVRVAG